MQLHSTNLARPSKSNQLTIKMKTLNQRKPQLGRGLAQALAGALLCALVSATTTDAQTLTHRWSFTDASDSIGTASVTLAGAATISGGALNVFGGAGASDYGSVDISSDYTNYISTTIECWFTTTTIKDWSKVWMFGNGGVNANAGTTYQDFTPNRGSTQSPGISITPYPFSGGDQAYAGSSQLPAGVEEHAVAVYNYGANTISLYINGVMVASGSMWNTTISNLACTQYRFGAGTSWGDASFTGSIDEMRVYNGPISPAQVEANYEAGPNSTSGVPGALTSIQFNNPNSTLLGGKFAPVILGNYASLTNKVNLSAVSGIAYSSDDTNVVYYGTDGLFHAAGLGTTTIRATYQSQPAALAITVTLQPAVVAHRYSFNGAPGTTVITDSVGGANGTLINGSATATLTGSGQLNLDGNPSSAWVSLPAGIVSALTNATFETWVINNDSNPNWAELWTFGTNNGASGVNYAAFIPNNPASSQARFDFHGIINAPTSLPISNSVCVTVTYNYSAQTASIFMGGRKVASGTYTTPLFTLPDVDNYLGQSQFYGNGDPYFNGVFDEFRIYNGVESDLQIAIDAATGPDTIVSNPGALQSVTVTTPTSNVDAHGTGVPVKVIANFANVANVDVTTLSGTTVTSSDSSVGTIVNGNFVPQNVGVSTVTGTYQGISGSVALTVVDTNAWPTLLHRWTFNDAPGSFTIADSVGTINGTSYGPVTNTGSLLEMPLGNPVGGSDGLPTAASGWGSFPANQGLVTGLPNEASIEIWVIWNGGGVWQEMFDFGQAATPGVSLGGGQYVMICPYDGANQVLRAEWDQNPTYDVTMQGPAPLPIGVLCQIVYSHDQDRQLDKLYLNGQLVTSAINTALWSSLPDTDNWLARDEWPDPMFNGSYSDMRFWNGALTAGQVASAYAAGPNVIVGPALQVTSGGSQITLKWPANASGYVLQSTSNLGGGTWTTVSGTPTVANGLNNLTIPATQAQIYYRLKK